MTHLNTPCCPSRVVPVRRCDKARGRQLGVETVLGDQHQMRETSHRDARADILQGDSRGETAERVEAGGRRHQARVVYLVLTEGILLQQVLVTATHLRRTGR